MKKHLILLFSGLALGAVSFGLFSSDIQTKQADAASSPKLEFDDDNKITLGSFPLEYDAKRSAQLNNQEIDPSTSDVFFDDTAFFGFKIGDEKYSLLGASVSTNDDSIMLSDGKTTAKSINGQMCIFKFVDLKWVKYDEGEDYIELISDFIVFRHNFHDSWPDNLKYVDSGLYEVLNDSFIRFAFSDEEREYLQPMSIEDKSDVKISIPELTKVTSSEPKCSGGSDYAICQTLSSIKGYKHGPYWTRTQSSTSDRKEVRWYGSETTSCLYTDPQIGVRPVIRVKASQVKSGGSSSSKSSGGSISTSAILGIIFGTIGAGALIAFLVLWSKKIKLNPGFKAPGWYYAIIFVATACCAVSVISFSVDVSGGGGGGGSGCFVPGYYVQTGQDSGTSNGIAFVQVGSTAWLLKADGTASYTGHLEDAENASDFSPDNYMTGTYTVSGSKLVITIPKTEIPNFGTVGGTYNYTIKNCKYLYSGNTEAYHWVRGE